MADSLGGRGQAGVREAGGGRTPSLQETGTHEMYILGFCFWAQGQERAAGSEPREEQGRWRGHWRKLGPDW